ncbi:MAG TPA: hypothetical protein VMF13_15945 [Luteitalea sp.]|nr:hypothetical protein [Luteitalea sp.]
MNESLREALRGQARELSQAVLDRMYENPFWMERYGARGRGFADEDSLHHMRYLDEALAAGEPAVFERYARWLRTVLVSRGMCTEHLAENFRLLASGIEAASVAEASVAVSILTAGADALRYTEGDAGRLQQDEPRLLDAIRASAAGRAMRDDDRRYLVSYVIDAAATGVDTHLQTFAARCPADVVAALAQATASH